MKKFDNIHNKQIINEGNITLSEYVDALKDLKDGLTNKKNNSYDILDRNDFAKMYYTNAINLGHKSGFFTDKLRKTINKINKEFANLGGKPIKDIIIENIDFILKNIDNVKENTGVASLGAVNGMGAVQLPAIDGIGSGDLLGAIGATNEVGELKEPKSQKSKMKKFEIVKEHRELNESELYIPIIRFADPSKLISVLAKDLSKKYLAKETEIARELVNIEISYNGIVNIFTLDNLSNLFDKKPKEVKTTIDSLIAKNIGLLENMQVVFITKLLNDPKSINESFLGRLVGGVAGFTFGPSIGKIVAKVLGIEQGPLFNILTSRVVSAALAQELTKNII